MKIMIITDSAADLPFEFRDKYNIPIVYQRLFFDNRDWKVGVDIPVREYYHKLKKMKAIPKSSVPSPQDFRDIFQSCFKEKDYDHVIYVGISESLTGTLNVARVASQEYSDKVTIIDTESASGVQGLITIAVTKLVERNLPIDKIVEEVEKLKERSILDVGFYTLENVYKSGRLKSKFILNLTKLIGIKPIAVMEQPGKLVSKLPGFVFGFHMENRLTNIIVKRAKKDITYDMIISHVENLKGSTRIANKIKKKLKIRDFYVTDAEPIIGSNTGMKTIIVSVVPSID